MNALRRGQSLVLAALTVLLLTVLVLGTLSIGSRIRKKVELQTVADAAAHSRAVLVARAFNLFSRANRAQASEMVSAAGVQALISWSSLHLVLLDKAREAMDANARFAPDCSPCVAALPPGASNAPWCSCDCARARAAAAAASNRLAVEAARVRAAWEPLEAAAFQDEEDYRTSALDLYKLESDAMSDLVTDVTPQRVSRDFMRLAARGDNSLTLEWTAPLFQDRVSMGEVATAIEAPALDNTVALKLAMGTRGASFVTSRDGASGATTARFAQVLGAGDARVDAALGGATYFANDRQHGDPGLVGDRGLWSEDHGDVTSRVEVHANGPRADQPAQCPDFAASRNGSTADVVTSLGPMSDNHRMNGVRHIEPAGRHQVTPCDCAAMQALFGSPGYAPTCASPCSSSPHFTTLSHPAAMAQALAAGQVCGPCPGVYPLFIRTSDPTPAADIFKQPKHYAVITRSPVRGAGDPWSLRLRFGFARGPGGGARFDSTGDLDRSGALDSPELEDLMALATGVTYYHYRGAGGWREEPNFFNMYWRGTLSTPDIDADGRNVDLPATLDALGGNTPLGAPRRGWDALRAQGWKGTQ